MKKENKLILIGGGTGSGKTTVAKAIIEKAGRKNVLLVSMDHYYKDFSYLPKSKREDVNFDHPDAIDWALMKKQIYALLDGNPVEMPIYSFITHTREGYRKIYPKKIVVLEGIFALYDEELNKKAVLRVYVDTDPDIRLIRRIKRDVVERGMSIERNIQMWLKYVKPMHEEFIEPTKKNAHIIIPEDPDGRMRETAIDLIKTKIKSMLKKQRKKTFINFIS